MSTMLLASFSVRTQGNVMAVLSMLLWSTSFPISEVLLMRWDALSLAVVRLGGGALMLTLMGWGIRNRYSWTNWPVRSALMIGAVGIGIGTFALNLGLKYSNPVNVSVIVTTIPLFSVMLGVIKHEETLSPRIMIAIGLAICGGVLVSWSSTQTQAGFQGGELLVLGAVILWTWYSRVSVTRLLVIPAYPRTVLTILGGALCLIPVALVLEGSGWVDLNAPWSVSDLPLIGGLCAFGVGLSMVCWMISAEKIGVTIAALHINALPFYVLLLGLMFGGTLLMSQVTGAVLVATGAVLAQIPAQRSGARPTST
ncbi:MAG: DMT family transporter [Arenicellales bacterium]|nr:DMT family transporter [Arenicellales bacterium]MDP7451918.1 DMT family transporter [Arenicellales bacterium]MDP7616970.1 DMT family transporter [Arenicellales bacterium]HJL51865.1 DMT family transporter [Arenicellales bacterium]